LATTRAALYAYGWLTRDRPWQEGLAVLMATEICSDNWLLIALGGGGSFKKAKVDGGANSATRDGNISLCF